jgi:transcription antitermination factor NusG
MKEIEEPLFPGYVFCKLDPSNQFPVLVTPGVISIVGAGKKPIPIDDSEMSAIETAVRSGVPREPWPFLHIGQRVSITSGPLSGLEGILHQVKDSRRLVLSVTLLRRSVAVQIESDWVRPFPPSNNYPSMLLSPRAETRP